MKSCFVRFMVVVMVLENSVIESTSRGRQTQRTFGIVFDLTAISKRTFYCAHFIGFRLQRSEFDVQRSELKNV